MKEEHLLQKIKLASNIAKHKHLYIISKALKLSQKQYKTLQNKNLNSNNQIKLQFANSTPYQGFDNMLKNLRSEHKHKKRNSNIHDKFYYQPEQIKSKYSEFKNISYDISQSINEGKDERLKILENATSQQKSRLQTIFQLKYSNQANQKTPTQKFSQKMMMKEGINEQKLDKSEQKKEVILGSPQTTLYDFKKLDKFNYDRLRTKIINYQEIKNNNKIQLSPIKKFQKELANYIQNQYFNIQKIKTKKQDENIPTKTTLDIQPKNLELNPQKYNFIQSNIKKKQISEAKISDISYQEVFQKKPVTAIDEKTHRISEKIHKNEYDNLAEFTLTRKNFIKKEFFVFGLSEKPPSQNKIQLYRDFLWKVNFSNCLFIEPELQFTQNYKIYIGPGNNSMLIKGLIRRRFWWTIVDKPTQDTNFIWTQLKNNDFFKQQQNSNRIKSRNKSIRSLIINTNQDVPFQNKRVQTTMEREQSKKKSIKNKKNKKKVKKAQIITVPKNFHQNLFSQEDLYNWNSYMQKNKKDQQTFSQKINIKRALLLKNKNAIKIQNTHTLKVHNHFNSNFFIGNKKALFYSMRKYYQLNNMNVFQYLPVTFHISKGTDDVQYHKFQNYYNEINQKRIKDRSIRNIWIVKPGQFTNRGTGITVCASLDDVKVRLKGRQKNLNGKYRTFIVQKYIQKPLLYHKRKFDIRHYMMITCINGQFKGYWYQEGYIRTTSYEYTIRNCKDNSIHLTNDAIQKHTQQYGKYQKGNKISYTQFQKYLDIHYKDYDFFNVILPKMKKICTQAIRASYSLLDFQRKLHNFQIFGMDFMIDQQFNPWLIEINTNPCLQLSCPLLAKIIPSFVQNAFKIALDPLFQPSYNWPSNKKYQLGDNPLQTNKFEIIFDQSIQGERLQQLYRNVDKIDKNMGEIQQQDQEYEDEGKQWNQEL